MSIDDQADDVAKLLRNEAKTAVAVALYDRDQVWVDALKRHVPRFAEALETVGWGDPSSVVLMALTADRLQRAREAWQFASGLLSSVIPKFRARLFAGTGHEDDGDA